MKILSIDPGPEKSAYVVWDGTAILKRDILENTALLMELRKWFRKRAPINAEILVIEQVANMGMAVGATVFETVFWSGRFIEGWQIHRGVKWARIKRHEVKMHLCGSMRAKDSNIRQALIDRFEPGLKPRQRPKGLLKGVHDDEWAALALGVTWFDKNIILGVG